MSLDGETDNVIYFMDNNLPVGKVQKISKRLFLFGMGKISGEPWEFKFQFYGFTDPDDSSKTNREEANQMRLDLLHAEAYF